MASNLILPTDETQLAALIAEHFAAERVKYLPVRTMMRLIWMYLSGARRFDVMNLTTGDVRGFQVDKEGRLEYQGGDLLRAIDQLAAYLTSYDLSPRVYSDGSSLSSLRESAVAQVLCDSVFSSDDIDRTADLFAHQLVALGGCGLAVHVDDSGIDSIGLSADLEVVHPNEIVPFPDVNMDLGKQSGIGREYWVPIEKLEKVRSKAWVKANIENMYYGKYRANRDPSMMDQGGALSGLGGAAEGSAPFNYMGGEQANGGSEAPTNAEDKIFVRVQEVWLYGPRGTCSRKIAVSGKKVIQDGDYSGVETYCPLTYSRFMNNGTFHGAGLFHLLYSLSRNMERINKSLFQEVTDRERLGWLVVPQGAYNANNQTREVGTGLKLLSLEPDPFSETGFRPFVVQPNNVGDSNTRVAMYAKQAFEGLNPIVDLVREKGRVDSERGLAFLQEQIDRAMTSPTRGVLRAFSDVYKAGLAQAATKIITTDRPIPVGKLTLDLAGAVIDWEEGSVRFKNNPVPSLSRLTIRPKMGGPRSKAQRKAEAIELLKVGVGDPTRLILKAFEEGWDLAMWTGVEESAHRSVVKKILSLYGDGENPGQMVENPHFARPDIQMLYLDSFMSSPKMAEASPEVQNAFIDYRRFLIENSGRMLPEGLPYNPEDVAAASQGELGAMQAMMGGNPMLGAPPVMGQPSPQMVG